MAACTHGLGKSPSSLIDPSSGAGSTVLIYISLLRKCCYFVVVEIIYRSKKAEDTLEGTQEFASIPFAKQELVLCISFCKYIYIYLTPSCCNITIFYQVAIGLGFILQENHN